MPKENPLSHRTVEELAYNVEAPSLEGMCHFQEQFGIEKFPHLVEGADFSSGE